MADRPFFVAAARTIIVAEGEALGPGAEVTLPAAEAAHLVHAGFLSEIPPELPPVGSDASNPAAIGWQGGTVKVRGPVY